MITIKGGDHETLQKDIPLHTGYFFFEKERIIMVVVITTNYYLKHPKSLFDTLDKKKKKVHKFESLFFSLRNDMADTSKRQSQKIVISYE